MNAKLGMLAVTSVLLLAACGGTTPTPDVVAQPNKPTPSQPGKVEQPLLKLATETGIFYINAAGVQVPITDADLQNAGTRFVFYAYLEDEAGGINPALIGGTGTQDPGRPGEGERVEVAPSGYQNVAGAYVGYRADDGSVFPVIGADVRWDIQNASNTTVQFAAADDGGQPSGRPRPLDINDNAKSAFTTTNSATGRNVRFPSSPSNPLYNLTGVGTPDRNGFTWTALFSPRAAANAQITAIAYVNGTEIGKTFLDKTFAPSAELTIDKVLVAGPEQGGTAETGINQSRQFSIRVTNRGAAAATNIMLSDVLGQGNRDAYTPTSIDNGGALNQEDGFMATFDLAAGESREFLLNAQASQTGVYCDVVNITSFTNGAFGTVTPGANTLQDQACFVVTAPELTIFKTLVDANGNPIMGDRTSPFQVAPGQDVRARITVVNNGTTTARNVVVTDSLNTPNGTTYNLLTQQPTVGGDVAGITTTYQPETRGFTTSGFALAPGQRATFTLDAEGTADGLYCDISSFTSDNNNPNLRASGDACFQVTSPNLAIAKVNNSIAGQAPITGLTPGSSYQSVITVNNTGTGTATTVAVTDLLGNNGVTSATFGSGTYTVDNDGNAANGVVLQGSLTPSTTTANTVMTNPATITLQSNETLTLTLTSTIPAGARPGQYCDVATYTSANAGTGNARACVNVISFVARQTQLVDTRDPIRNVLGTTTDDTQNTGITFVTSAGAVEPGSNEALRNNVFTVTYGTTNAQAVGGGLFSYRNVEVYSRLNPDRDPTTGTIRGDLNAATRLVEGTDYTLTQNSGVGQVQVTLNPARLIVPDEVIFIRARVSAPGVQPGQYNDTFQWTSVTESGGAINPAFSSEPTTVIP